MLHRFSEPASPLCFWGLWGGYNTSILEHACPCPTLGSQLGRQKLGRLRMGMCVWLWERVHFYFPKWKTSFSGTLY